jgi:hypothetical protein
MRRFNFISTIDVDLGARMIRDKAVGWQPVIYTRALEFLQGNLKCVGVDLDL